MIDKRKIVSEFNRIKSLGYLPSRRKKDTGIGKTFEDYLGVDENNKKDPDFDGFEVKSQRQMTKSKITLFTKSPTYPKGANRVLKDSYGTPDESFHDIKVLHTSFYGDRFNTHASGFGFKLFVNNNESRVEFLAKDLSNGTILNPEIYWSFDDLRKCIDKKLRALFVVLADSRKSRGREEFHYTEAKVFYNLYFDRFMSGVASGLIQFDIRMGAYKTKGRANYGKPHDHGSGFRVGRDDLHLLFEEVFDID